MILSQKRGFTLVELLVVIAIIGILAAMILSSLGSARSKARDASRKNDLAQLRLALEQYADDKGGVYVPSTTALKWDNGSNAPAALTTALVSNYTAKVPLPQRAAELYGYITNTGTTALSGFPTPSAENTQYALEARLEKPATSTSPVWQVKSIGTSGESASAITGI